MTIFLAALAKIGFVLLLLLGLAPAIVWAERRQSSMMQDRVGPIYGGVWVPKMIVELSRFAAFGALAVGVLSGLGMLGSAYQCVTGHAGEKVWSLPWALLLMISSVSTVLHLVAWKLIPLLIPDNGNITAWGFLHPLADVIKMLWKEDFVPPGADKLLFAIAPIISLIPAFITFAVIPFGPTLYLDRLLDVAPMYGEEPIGLQVANLNVGLLYMFAVAGTGIVGAAIGGYSSNNKYALLGGLRAASQMVSYEVTLGLTLVGCFMMYDTIVPSEMVLWQQRNVWGIFAQPLAFVLFFTAATAENKRIPFDAPEGESEIVAGYFLEYSGMKFGMFFMGEFLEIITLAAVMVTLFFGGYDLPFFEAKGWSFAWGELAYEPRGVWAEILNSHLFLVVAQVLAFISKVVLLIWLQMMVRWTLPRFRYDQTMSLCWKLILPLSLLNIFVTGIVVMLTKDTEMLSWAAHPWLSTIVALVILVGTTLTVLKWILEKREGTRKKVTRYGLQN